MLAVLRVWPTVDLMQAFQEHCDDTPSARPAHENVRTNLGYPCSDSMIHRCERNALITFPTDTAYRVVRLNLHSQHIIVSISDPLLELLSETIRFSPNCDSVKWNCPRN